MNQIIEYITQHDMPIDFVIGNNNFKRASFRLSEFSPFRMQITLYPSDGLSDQYFDIKLNYTVSLKAESKFDFYYDIPTESYRATTLDEIIKIIQDIYTNPLNQIIVN